MSDLRVKDRANFLRDVCHLAALEGGWWDNKPLDYVERYIMANDTIHYPDELKENWVKIRDQLLLNIKGTKIALMHSEASEALEGVRKGIMDEKLPHRTAEEVELADLVIRIMDYCGKYNLDIGGAMAEKMDFNAVREDHKPENRAKSGGKAF